MSDIELTPTQAKLLVDSYRNGGTLYSGRNSQPATARKLINQGLAEYAMGVDYPGGKRRAISVWGGPLTERGKLIARTIILEEEGQ